MIKNTTLQKRTRIVIQSDPLDLPDWGAFRPEIAVKKLRKLYSEERDIINKLSSRNATHGEIFKLRAPLRRKIIALIGELYHLDRVAKNQYPGITDAVRSASFVIEKFSEFLAFHSKYPAIITSLNQSAPFVKLSPSERWYLAREKDEFSSAPQVRGKMRTAISSAQMKLSKMERVFAEKDEINDTAVLQMIALRSQIAELSRYSSWNEMVLRGLMMSEVGVSGVSALFKEFKKRAAIWHIQKLKNYRTPLFAARYTEDNVLEAIKEILQVNFGITLVAYDASVWARDVLFFRAYTEDGTLLGGLYADLYEREEKRGGAWSGAIRDGEDGIFPLAMIVTNFTSGKRISHYEFLTLVHELGHAVHYLCAQPDSYLGYVRYLEDDAVEIAGRFFERFAFDAKIVRRALLGKKKKLSQSQNTFIAKLPEYRRAFLIQDRSLDIAVSEFDWEIHLHPIKRPEDLHQAWREVHSKLILDAKDHGSIFPSILRYIFDGRYSGKFVLYIWADIIAAELYLKYRILFKRSPKKARAMLLDVFQKGSSAPMMDILKPILGARITIDAYLKEITHP